MSIIIFLGKNLKEYRNKSREYLNQHQWYCEKCNGRMKYHGCYNRGIKDSEESISINRLCCQNNECRHSEAALPDFLLPYKHYSADEIEAVLMDSCNMAAEEIETTASVPTIRRWVRQIGVEIQEWISILASPTYKVQFEFTNLIEQLAYVIEQLPSIKKCGNILGAAKIHIINRTHKLI